MLFFLTCLPALLSVFFVSDDFVGALDSPLSLKVHPFDNSNVSSTELFIVESNFGWRQHEEMLAFVLVY